MLRMRSVPHTHSGRACSWDSHGFVQLLLLGSRQADTAVSTRDWELARPGPRACARLVSTAAPASALDAGAALLSPVSIIRRSKCACAVHGGPLQRPKQAAPAKHA